MSDPVRLVLVGCGWISGAHVKGYRELVEHGIDNVVYSAVCDMNQERARERADELEKIQGRAPCIFTAIDELLAAGIADGADLCLPHCFHHTLACECLEGGLHVLLEKPLGVTIRASRKIIQCADEHGRVLATAENIRRSPGARACAWAIRERRLIGDIHAVHVQNISYKPFDIDKPQFKWRVLKNLVGGGMIMDSGAHFTDMLRVLFGDPGSVYCSMATHDDRMVHDAPLVGDAKVDVEDAWHAIITFAHGLNVTWSYARSYPGADSTFGHYYGSAGMIRDLGFPFHNFQGSGEVLLADGTVITGEELKQMYLDALPEAEHARLFPGGCTDSFGIEIWDFADAIQTGRKPEMDGEEGLRSKALCECCYESACRGEPVGYEDVLSGKIADYQAPINDFWKL